MQYHSQLAADSALLYHHISAIAYYRISTFLNYRIIALSH